MTRLNKKTLLQGVSVLAMSAFMAQSASAAALTGAVSNTTDDDNTTTGDVTIGAGVTVTENGGGSQVLTLSNDLTVTGASALLTADVNALEVVVVGSDDTTIDIDVDSGGVISQTAGTGANLGVIDINGDIGSIETNATGTITSTAAATLIDIATGKDVANGITNAGTISGGAASVGINFAGTSDTDVTNSGTIDIAGAGKGIDVQGALTGFINNSGKIETTGGEAIDAGADISGGITNSGTITDTAGGSGIEITGAGTYSITNSGTISSASGEAIVVGATLEGDISNTGTINGGSGTGVDVNSAITGSISNSSTGTITATGGGIGIDVGAGVSKGVTNAGTINAVTGDAINVSAAATADITSSGTIALTGAGKGIDVGGALAGTVTNSGTISGVTGAGIGIDVSAAATGVNILSSGTISGDSGNGIDIGASAGTVANSGTISFTGAGVGIDITGTSTVAGSVTNSGSISVVGGTGIHVAGALTSTLVNSGTISNDGGIGIDVDQAITGDLTNSGTITIATSGDGIDFANVNVSGTFSNSGSISVQDTAVDMATVASGNAFALSNTGTITTAGTTAVALGADGTYTHTSGSITGGTNAVLGLTGAERVNIHGGTISGNINLDGDAGDRVDIGDATSDSITSGGTLVGLDDLNITGTYTIGTAGHNITSAVNTTSTIIVGASSKLDVNANATITGEEVDFQNGSTLEIGAGVTATLADNGDGNFDFESGSTLEIDFNSTSSFGVLDSSGDAQTQIDFADGGVTINVDTSGATTFTAATTIEDVVKTAANTDLLVGGSQIVDTTNDDINVTDNSFILNFALGDVDGDGTIDLDITRVGYNTASSKGNESAVGTALETIGAGGDSSLDTVVGALDGLANAGAVEAALETLTPEVNGMTSSAVADATAGAQGTVSTRVASLRGNAAGIATGADFRDTAAWGEFFGGSADQADRDDVRGYQADIFGGSIGIDAEVANNLVLGVAASYSQTDADSARGSAEADTYQGTLYGSYSENGNWYDAQLSVGFSDYETSRNLSVGSIADTAKADFDGINYAAKFEVGRDIKVQGPLQFTPRAGFEYTLITQDSYTETGSSANLTVDNDDIQKLDLGVGFDLSYPLVANGVSYLPELRFGYKYDVIGDEVEATSKFTSASTTFKSEGADVAESTFEFGAGIDILAQDNLTVSFDYDTTQREDYEAHIGSVKARFAF